jgi:creatinine amidohydrolase
MISTRMAWSAEKGHLICKHIARGFVALLEDLKAYPLSNLYSP